MNPENNRAPQVNSIQLSRLSFQTMQTQIPQPSSVFVTQLLTPSQTESLASASVRRASGYHSPKQPQRKRQQRQSGRNTSRALTGKLEQTVKKREKKHLDSGRKTPSPVLIIVIVRRKAAASDANASVCVWGVVEVVFDYTHPPLTH